MADLVDVPGPDPDRYRIVGNRDIGKETETITVPDLIEPITGYRLWKLLPDGRLQSIADSWIWEPGVANKARCNKGEDHLGEEPRLGCGCGFWALKSIQRAAYYGNYGVIGEVALWGRVVVGRDGWRAQYAYPKRIVALLKDGQIDLQAAEKLPQLYECEVKSVKETEFLEALNLGRFGGNTSVSI